MQIICISRGTLNGGKALAERLAADLGYDCLSREALLEEAVNEGLQIAELERALGRPELASERLALEAD